MGQIIFSNILSVTLKDLYQIKLPVYMQNLI